MIARNPLEWISSLFKAEQPNAAVPPGARVYAVGDIHGRLDLLKKLWAMIEARHEPGLEDTIIFLGDYVDRGRDSKGVIEFLKEAMLRDKSVICLRGNHDQSVLDFLADANFYRSWKPFGAPETLLSYGVTPPRFDSEDDFERARKDFVNKCPADHIRFLEALPHSLAFGDYFFAHAGARPGIKLEDQDIGDLLWIREDFLRSRSKFEKVVVYGHTPLQEPYYRGGRIGVDTGAYATGRLTAAVLQDVGCKFIST